MTGYFRIRPVKGTKLKDFLFVNWHESFNKASPDINESKEWITAIESCGGIRGEHPGTPPSGERMGMIQKLGGGKILKQWQDRYCIIENGWIIYYKSEVHPVFNTTNFIEKGRIILKDAKVGSVPQQFKGPLAKVSFCFKLVPPRGSKDKDYFFNARGVDDREGWIANCISCGAITTTYMA